MTMDCQNLPLAADLREAVAAYARLNWPANTSLYVAQHWNVDKTTARNLLKGHASDATITKVLRTGGWAMALAVVGAVIGQSLDRHIEEETERHARHAQRLAQTRAALRTLRERDVGDLGLAGVARLNPVAKGERRAPEHRSKVS